MFWDVLWVLAAGVAGLFIWTFAEYAVHAWGGHVYRRSVIGREHMAHHRDQTYFTPTVRKSSVAAAVVLLLGVLSGWLLGLAGLALAVGLGAGYVVGEVVHRRCHTHAPRGRYSRWARKHHLSHHFVHGASNFGITTPLWDIVFGTLRPAGRIGLPRRLAMVWLLDGEGRVRPEFAADYEVRG